MRRTEAVGLIIDWDSFVGPDGHVGVHYAKAMQCLDLCITKIFCIDRENAEQFNAYVECMDTLSATPEKCYEKLNQLKDMHLDCEPL